MNFNATLWRARLRVLRFGARGAPSDARGGRGPPLRTDCTGTASWFPLSPYPCAFGSLRLCVSPGKGFASRSMPASVSWGMHVSKSFLVALALLTVTLNPVVAAKVPRPNLVYILCDDLGYGDVRCLNPNGKIPTPHMDRLARAGMIFTDAHSSSSVCTPTRYSLLTGRYNWRSRLKQGVLYGYSPRLIDRGGKRWPLSFRSRVMPPLAWANGIWA